MSSTYQPNRLPTPPHKYEHYNRPAIQLPVQHTSPFASQIESMYIPATGLYQTKLTYFKTVIDRAYDHLNRANQKSAYRLNNNNTNQYYASHHQRNVSQNYGMQCLFKGHSCILTCFHSGSRSQQSQQQRYQSQSGQYSRRYQDITYAGPSPSAHNLNIPKRTTENIFHSQHQRNVSLPPAFLSVPDLQPNNSPSMHPVLRTRKSSPFLRQQPQMHEPVPPLSEFSYMSISPSERNQYSTEETLAKSMASVLDDDDDVGLLRKPSEGFSAGGSALNWSKVWGTKENGMSTASVWG